jgi:hypothetical protein
MNEKSTGSIDNEAFALRFLDPKKIKLFRVGDALRVTIEDDRSCLRVVPMRAFPISNRDRYISLCDMKGDELGMLRDLHELDRESRKLVEHELWRRYFTPVIRRIISITEKLGIVEWEVETDRGVRTFVTRSLHTSLKETDKGYIIVDMEDNRFEIRDLSDFDPQSVVLLNKKI